MSISTLLVYRGYPLSDAMAFEDFVLLYDRLSHENIMEYKYS